MSNVHQLFPDKNVEIEDALLSIILQYNSLYFDIMNTTIPDHFTDQLNRTVFEIISESIKSGNKIDGLILRHRLKELTANDPQEINEYTANIVGNYVSHVSLNDYARMLFEFYTERRTNQIMSMAASAKDKRKLINEMEASNSSRSGGFIDASAFTKAVIEKIDLACKNGGQLFGLKTGIDGIDNVICGFEPGGLYIIAGRPSMGKTALALTIAANIALQEKDVLFFSLEMSGEELSSRLIARYAATSMYEQRIGLPRKNYNQIHECAKRITRMRLKIDEQSGLTAQEIVARAVQMSTRLKPSLIVIDHLGIVAPRDAKTPRVYQVAEMTAAFKDLAKKLRVPVIVLHQLNRGVEDRDDKRPAMSDLRDSGSVEQDADAVLLLYRNQYYLEKSEPSDETKRQKWEDDMMKCQGKADVIIAKNRQGVTRTVKLAFDGARQVFEDVGM